MGRRWRLAAAADPAGPPLGGLSFFTLEVPAEECAALSALLSPDEQRRAARFHARQHADRFTVAHARLRQQLAAVLSVAPQRIEFALGKHGKPQLAGEFAQLSLEFNLSHSASLGLIGWAWRRAIGVDVEAWRVTRDESALVRRFFSTSEIAAYETQEPALRTQAFFNCWTRKEAYVKAVGMGLGLPLDSFDVSVGSSADARLLRASALHEDGRKWSLAAPEVEGEVSLAVVLEGDTFHIVADAGTA